jgi:hypothetical protein
MRVVFTDLSHRIHHRHHIAGAFLSSKLLSGSRCGELTMLRRNAKMSLHARTQWGEESRLLDPVLIAADRTKAILIGTSRQRLNVGDQLPSLFL